MKQIKDFNGKMKIQAIQTDKDNHTHYMEYNINGFKSLTLNQLAGTITKEIFADFKDAKIAGATPFKASYPVRLRITDSEGHYITDTVHIKKAYQVNLTLRSEAKFAKNLFLGLKNISRKVNMANVTDFITKESERIQIAAGDQMLWLKDMAEDAETISEVVDNETQTAE